MKTNDIIRIIKNASMYDSLYWFFQKILVISKRPSDTQNLFTSIKNQNNIKRKIIFNQNNINKENYSYIMLKFIFYDFINYYNNLLTYV